MGNQNRTPDLQAKKDALAAGPGRERGRGEDAAHDRDVLGDLGGVGRALGPAARESAQRAGEAGRVEARVVELEAADRPRDERLLPGADRAVGARRP